jgi:hypothetical protein
VAERDCQAGGATAASSVGGSTGGGMAAELGR